MRIALIDLANPSASYLNKEMNGGLGRRILLNGSLRSKLLMRVANKLFYTPPISLAYVGAIFSGRGFEVRLSRTEDIPADTDLALFQSSIADHENDLAAARRLKARNPRLKVGFTGAFPSFMPDRYLQAGDFVIVGEPETAAQKLFDSVEPSGLIRSEDPPDLDALPFPKWELFLEGENGASLKGGNLRGLPVYASRGCSFTCSYCPYIAYFGNTRMRKVENVYAEIERAVQKWGIRRFLFRDPDFTENRKRVLALMELIRKGNLGIRWSCETRLDLLNEELLDAMKAGGCIELGTGVESVSPEILKDVQRKAIADERIRKMTAYASKIGILVQANYILGFPEDTEESMKATIAYAQDLNTPLANFSIFTPYPGTKAWPSWSDKIVDKDFQNFDLAHLVFAHSNLKNETVRRYYTRAYESYYFRPSWLAKNLKLVMNSLLR